MGIAVVTLLVGFIMGAGIAVATMIARYTDTVQDQFSHMNTMLDRTHKQMEQARKQTQEIRGLYYTLLDEMHDMEERRRNGKPPAAKPRKPEGRRLLVDNKAKTKTFLLDGIDALVQLGHKRKDAKFIVKQTYSKHKPATLEELIRKCMINPS